MIEIVNLSRHFGQLTAIDDISFTVEAGEVLGFLGPNGAGKSTTMKMITGFLAPSSGSISVSGFDIGTQTIEAQKRIGYLPEGAPCYEDMNPLQFLGFIAAIRGFKGDEQQQKVAQVVTTMGLESVLTQKIETLSKGFKRRVGLAQAIIHNPEVLILDEPTDGLDPNQKHQVRNMIRSLSKDKIVIISTHILEEVTAVCTRATIIANGKIVSDCSPAELESKSRYAHAVTLHLTEQQSAATKLSELPGVSAVEVNEEGKLLTVLTEGGQSIYEQVNDLVRQESWQVDALYVEKGRLDEVFRKITEEVV
ncbi:MAG: ABC transporter ATP-binding protein [Pseudomonadales bacterium]|jgi:ABC-2 type transport system ATP-binding protein|nr:ABC transporter ATP-binding protein [Pseudomonadales bacterium]